MSSKRFIHEPITVEWDNPPTFTKVPHAPDRFTWQGEVFRVVDVLSEWADFERRGRMSRNMRPEHLRRARKRGSRGVGVYSYRVAVEGGRVFEIYYDRQPKDRDHPDGQWFINAEVEE